MIGNDVVDLRDPEARPGATHPRFDRRVFAPAERALLHASADPVRLRWVLWAAKEAAYKLARKLAPRTVFSPVRFVVRPDGAGGGAVEHAGRRFALRLEGDAGHVHALAAPAGAPRLEPPALLRGRIALAPDDPQAGAAVRAAARECVARALGVAPGALAFVREGRVPRLRLDGAPAPFDVSLSHHGRLAAFAAVPVAADPRR